MCIIYIHTQTKTGHRIYFRRWPRGDTRRTFFPFPVFSFSVEIYVHMKRMPRSLHVYIILCVYSAVGHCVWLMKKHPPETVVCRSTVDFSRNAFKTNNIINVIIIITHRFHIIVVVSTHGVIYNATTYLELRSV